MKKSQVLERRRVTTQEEILSFTRSILVPKEIKKEGAGKEILTQIVGTTILWEGCSVAPECTVPPKISCREERSCLTTKITAGELSDFWGDSVSNERRARKRFSQSRICYFAVLCVPY